MSDAQFSPKTGQALLLTKDKYTEWRVEFLPADEPSSAPILILTFDRPQAMNALDLQSMRGLESILEQTSLDELGALILYGAGGRFIAGGDLKALDTLRSAQDAALLSGLMQTILKKMSEITAPVICAIEGFAIGGGVEVSLACDLCVMAENAYLKFAQRSLGLSTAWGGSSHLKRAVGARQAFALLARQNQISAQEALHLGLAHQLAPSGEALKVALAWARDLASTPQATRSLKALCHSKRPTQADLDYERDLFIPLWTSALHWERVDRLWSRRKNHIQPHQRDSDNVQNQIRAHKGLFIVFEGIDGSGTTTQAQRLVAHLLAQGLRAHFTNEPSKGVLGALTRRALRGENLGREGKALPASALALMFAADRADHWHNEIQPRLLAGEHVVCDRYLYSSIAYQSLENPEEWIRALNRPFPQPDLLIYLQAPPNLAAERREQRGLEADRYEEDQLQIKIANAYDRICTEFDACILDASLTIEELGTACLKQVQDLLVQSSKD